MTALLGLLTSRLGAIGAWVAVAVLTILLVVAKVETRSAKHDLKQAALDRDTWKGASQQWERNYAVVHNALLLQNAAVDRLGSDRQAWEAWAKGEVRTAKQEARTAEQRAARWRAAVPKGEPCKAADDLILEAAR